jgi:hypothetical protein
MDVHQNAINSLGILERQLENGFEAWRAENPNGSLEEFSKIGTEISFLVNGVTVTITPAEWARRILAVENTVATTGAKGHWPLFAVGMLGGALFCGAFFAFVFLIVPVALVSFPVLGPVAAFFTASALNLSLGGVGAFLIGAFICAPIHRAIYPHACEPARLPGENDNPDSPPEEN